MENSMKIRDGKSYYCLRDEKYPVINKSFPEIYEEAAKRDQNCVIWHRPAERYSYRELYQRAQDIAKGLIAIGLKRGDCILGVGCQGSDGTVMFMAATSIGVLFTCPYIYSPTFNSLSAAIERVKPGVVLVGDVTAGAFHDRTFMTLNDVMKEMKESGKTLPTVFYDSISAQSDDCMKYNKFAQPLKSLVKQGKSTSEADLKTELSNTGINALSYYAFTSGSTGEPKLVVYGPNMFTNSFNYRNERLGLTKENVVFGVQNMTVDDVLYISDLLAGMMLGYPIVVFPKPVYYFDDDAITRETCDCIQKHKVTYIHIDQGSTRHIALTHSLRDEFDLTLVKGWMFTAAPLSESAKMEILKVYPTTSDSYGMTELGMITFPMPGLNCEKISSMGRALPNIEIKVCDEDGNVVDCGVKGEILVKGPSRFLFYKDQPELTRSMFTDNGFFKTGDCGWMDKDGDMFFVSRMSKAERYKVFYDVVYASPIEKVLSCHPKIKECCVVGIDVSSDTDTQEITYCIVPKEPDSITIKEVQTYAIENMSNQREWPRRIIFMDKLPRQGARKKPAKRKLIEDLEKAIEEDGSLYLVNFDFLKNV